MTEIDEARKWVEYWKEKREKVENGRRDEGVGYYMKMNKEALRQEILTAQDDNPIIKVLMRGRRITKPLLMAIMRVIDDEAIEEFKECERKAQIILNHCIRMAEEAEEAEEPIRREKCRCGRNQEEGSFGCVSYPACCDRDLYDSD